MIDDLGEPVGTLGWSGLAGSGTRLAQRYRLGGRIVV